MRNLIESIAVGAVILLSVIIVALIVQYNMIEEESLDDIGIRLSVKKDTSFKDQAKNNYLDTLEGYSDVDVEVDPTQEDKANRVVVNSESKDNLLDDAVKDNYVDNLEHYRDKINERKQPEENNDTLEPTLPKAEIDDVLGQAIDDIVKDTE